MEKLRSLLAPHRWEGHSIQIELPVLSHAHGSKTDKKHGHIAPELHQRPSPDHQQTSVAGKLIQQICGQ